MKECLVSYLTSDRLTTGGSRSGRVVVFKIRAPVLQHRDLIFSAIEGDGRFPWNSPSLSIMPYEFLESGKE